MSSKEYDDDDEMELDDVDEELTQEDTWSVVSAFFDEFQMVSATVTLTLPLILSFYLFLHTYKKLHTSVYKSHIISI